MSYQGWAILEIEGRGLIAGNVSEAEGFGETFVRVDVPHGPTELFAPKLIKWIRPTTEVATLAFNSAFSGLFTKLGNALAPEPEPEAPKAAKPARGKKAEAKAPEPEPEAPKEETPGLEPEPEEPVDEAAPGLEDGPTDVEVEDEPATDDVDAFIADTLPHLSSFAEVGKALPTLYALPGFAARSESGKSMARAQVWSHIKTNIDPGFDPLSHPVAFNLYMHTLFDPDRVQEAFEAFQGSEIWPRIPEGNREALRGYVGARIAQLSQQQEAA